MSRQLPAIKLSAILSDSHTNYHSHGHGYGLVKLLFVDVDDDDDALLAFHKRRHSILQTACP